MKKFTHKLIAILLCVAMSLCVIFFMLFLLLSDMFRFCLLI